MDVSVFSIDLIMTRKYLGGTNRVTMTSTRKLVATHKIMHSFSRVNSKNMYIRYKL